MPIEVPGVDLVEIACHHGGLSDTALTVGTGLKSFVLTADSPPLLQDMEVVLRRLGDPAVMMRGRVMSRPWDAAVSLLVTASSGTGTYADWLVAEGWLRFSSGEQGYWTRPTDDPAQIFWPGCLAQSLDLRYDLFARGTTYGESRLEVGDIALVRDRDLSCLLDYGLTGQRVRIWRLPREDQAFADASLLLVGEAMPAVVSGRQLIIRVRGRAGGYDRPVQVATYAGTNALPAGLEGTGDDIKGQRKPLSFGGLARECPLTLVNASRLILQASTGVVVVSDLADMGQPLTAAAPYASKAEMESTAPARGQYRVWSGAEGTFVRLGATPAGTITADITTQALAADQRPGAIMRAIVSGPGGLSSGEIDGAALTALDAACPWPCAFWVEQGETIAQLLDRVCAAFGGWWAFTPTGVFTAGPLSLASPAFKLRRMTPDSIADASTYDIVQSEILALSDEEAGAPIYAVQIGYGRVMTPNTDPAGSVTAARRAYLAQEYRMTAEAADSLTLARNPGARRLELQTDQTGEAGAIAMRDQQLALRKGRKRRVSIATRLPPAVLAGLRLGVTINVQDADLGLRRARDMLLLSLAHDGRRGAVILGLWG